MTSDGTCAVCGCAANKRCSRCYVTAYCGREHQVQHWKDHKLDCSPLLVQESKVLGRYMVAARDIQAGEVVLRDAPIVLGPRQFTAPVCVGCSAAVNGTCSCSSCGWPLCNSDCQQVTLHEPECQASKARGAKVVISKFFQLNEMYECITPLRCLWLQKDEAKWKQLMSMQTHLEDRKKNKSTELDKSNVIDFIRGYLKFQDFVDDDVYKICGILEVNGFEIPAPNFVGLYAKACLLEHSCIPNTNRTFDTKMNVVIRASVDIKKGSHISTTYTDPMWGSYSRQLHLKTTKYFTCQCDRCSDPTELNTHYSSIKCQHCEALIPPPPIEPTQTKKNWTCPSCEKSVSSDTVRKLLKTWGSMLANLRGNVPDSEEFLKNSESDFSENHHYRTDVKLALAQLMGKQTEAQLTGLTPAQLHRKLSLCKEVLSLVEVFNPGVSRLRGLLQFEAAMSNWELHRRKDKNSKTNKKALPLLQETLERLDVAHCTLSLESEMQEEHKVAAQAAEVKGMVTKAIGKCKKK